MYYCSADNECGVSGRHRSAGSTECDRCPFNEKYAKTVEADPDYFVCEEGKSADAFGSTTRGSLEDCKNRFLHTGENFIYYAGSKHCQATNLNNEHSNSDWTLCKVDWSEIHRQNEEWRAKQELWNSNFNLDHKVVKATNMDRYGTWDYDCSSWGCTCQGLANLKLVRPGISWGKTDEGNKKWWNENDCESKAKSAECPARCSTCPPGNSDNVLGYSGGGRANVNGVCVDHCSVTSVCGATSFYMETDCTPCAYPENLETYSCSAGQGRSGGPYVELTGDNSESACAAACATSAPICVAFDYTTRESKGACRLYSSTANSRTNAGADNRKFCIPDTDSIAPAVDDGPQCMTADVGNSGEESKIIPMDDKYKCPQTISKSNWDKSAAGGYANVGDTMSTSQSGGKLTVTRKGHSGWGINLKFQCCNSGATVQKTYSCSAGQGRSGGPYVQTTSDNSESACAALCSTQPGTCVAFDYTTRESKGACRLYSSTANSRTNAGADNRKFCIPDTDSIAPAVDDGPQCMTADVGNSGEESKIIPMDDKYKCPQTISKSNWDKSAAGGYANVGDTMSTSQSGGKLTVTRKGHSGWGINLKFQCCKSGATVQAAMVTSDGNLDASDLIVYGFAAIGVATLLSGAYKFYCSNKRDGFHEVGAEV